MTYDFDRNMRLTRRSCTLYVGEQGVHKFGKSETGRTAARCVAERGKVEQDFALRVAITDPAGKSKP